jgi:hypothetical protein
VVQRQGRCAQGVRGKPRNDHQVPPLKIGLIIMHYGVMLIAIKLLRTDTTLDLSHYGREVL